MQLRTKHCVSCEGGVPKLGTDEARALLSQLSGWEMRDEKLHKLYRFKNFVEAMRFVNRMADVAEREGHHPDFTVHYREVAVTIWTHAVGGLSENDFVLADKIDAL